MTSRGSISLLRLFAAVTTLALAWLATPLFNSAALADEWTTTGSMTDARSRYTATLLSNGTVLVAGGTNGDNLAEAELYNAGTWTVINSMNHARSQHTATLLQNGTVLVAGGADATAELFNAGTWTVTGSMAASRASHTATLLPNGKVLVTGGFNASGYTASAELYDPTTNSWSSAGTMTTARAFHTATLLPSGKVLVAGGWNGNVYDHQADLYDPTAGTSGTWSATGAMADGRGSHTATLLPNGKVLVTGGSGNPSNSTILATA